MGDYNTLGRSLLRSRNLLKYKIMIEIKIMKYEIMIVIKVGYLFGGRKPYTDE